MTTESNTTTSTGISKKIKIVLFCLAALLAVVGLSALGAQMMKRDGDEQANGLAFRDASSRAGKATGTADLAETDSAKKKNGDGQGEGEEDDEEEDGGEEEDDDQDQDGGEEEEEEEDDDDDQEDQDQEDQDQEISDLSGEEDGLNKKRTEPPAAPTPRSAPPAAAPSAPPMAQTAPVVSKFKNVRVVLEKMERCSQTEMTDEKLEEILLDSVETSFLRQAALAKEDQVSNEDLMEIYREATAAITDPSRKNKFIANFYASCFIARRLDVCQEVKPVLLDDDGELEIEAFDLIVSEPDLPDEVINSDELNAYFDPKFGEKYCDYFIKKAGDWAYKSSNLKFLNFLIEKYGYEYDVYMTEFDYAQVVRNNLSKKPFNFNGEDRRRFKAVLKLLIADNGREFEMLPDSSELGSLFNTLLKEIKEESEGEGEGEEYDGASEEGEGEEEGEEGDAASVYDAPTFVDYRNLTPEVRAAIQAKYPYPKEVEEHSGEEGSYSSEDEGDAQLQEDVPLVPASNADVDAGKAEVHEWLVAGLSDEEFAAWKAENPWYTDAAAVFKEKSDDEESEMGDESGDENGRSGLSAAVGPNPFSEYDEELKQSAAERFSRTFERFKATLAQNP